MDECKIRVTSGWDQIFVESRDAQAEERQQNQDIAHGRRARTTCRPRFRPPGRTVRRHADLSRAADGNALGHRGRLIGCGAPTTTSLPECDPGPRLHRSALRKTIDSRPAGQAGGPVAVPFHPGISSACGPNTASILARPANRARQGTADHHTDARDRDL